MNIKKNIKKIGMLSLFALMVNVGFANTIRHIVWNKNFLTIHVPLNQEKIIEVCGQGSTPEHCHNVTFTPYLPEKIVSSGQLKWIHANGALYLNARKSFQHQLAELKLHNASGDVILVYLSSDKTANDDHLQILLSDASKEQGSQPSGNVQEDQSIGDMVRWVAQQLYAPKRLLTQPNWIYRVPMHVARFVPLYRGGVVSAMPLASWRSGDYYITAVLVRNVLSKQRVHLRHQMLRGQWIASSFFRQGSLNPAILTQARTVRDSTTAILISTVPFHTALTEGATNA